MAVIAKLKVERITEYESGKEVHLRAVYDSDPNGVNYTWSKATPNGEIRLYISNPGAFNQFIVGKSYLVTFNEIT